MKNIKKIVATLFALVSLVVFATAEDTYKLTLTRVNASKKQQTVQVLAACGVTNAAAETAFEQVKRGNPQVVRASVTESYAKSCISRIQTVGGTLTMTKNPQTASTSSSSSFSQATVQNAYTVLLVYSASKDSTVNALANFGVPKNIAENAFTVAERQRRFALITGGASQSEANQYISKIKSAGGLALSVKNTSSTPFSASSKNYTVTLKGKGASFNIETFRNICKTYGLTNTTALGNFITQISDPYAIDFPVRLTEYNASNFIFEMMRQKQANVISVTAN